MENELEISDQELPVGVCAEGREAPPSSNETCKRNTANVQQQEKLTISTFKNLSTLVTPHQHTALPWRESKQGICVPRATAELFTPEMPGQPVPATTATVTDRDKLLAPT